jgi:hypothetical protein
VSIKKRAKGRVKTTAKKAPANKSVAKNRSAKKKKGKDIVQVRDGINELVKASARKIANKVIEVATRTGQLASAKYLFEAVGLYPPTEETAAPVPLKDTLAHTLLTRMGIPTEPVNHDEDDEVAVPASDAKGPKAAVTAAAGENEAGAEREDEVDPGGSVQ